MTTQMLIKLDSAVKERFARLAQREGKTASQAIREAMEEYIREHDLSAQVDDLWDRIGGKLKKAGFRAKDVPRVVREVRRGR